jgi:N-acyl-D-amino-acid deacylase
MIKSWRSLLIAPWLIVSGLTQAADRLDWLIENGLLVDGTGAPPREASIGSLKGKLVVFAANESKPVATRVIDAKGYIVAPGFIDLHTHARADLLSTNDNAVLNYLTQGVTTLVIGNDGDGTPHIEERFRALEQNQVGVNVVQFVGHGALRRQHVGNDNRLATEDELRSMEAALERALQEGAAGLSLGLFYVPGSYAPTSEVIRLCRVAARHGKPCEAHIRSESARGAGVLTAIDEMITIGRESGAAIHIGHIKVLGRSVWGQSTEVIARIEAAQAEGLSITADQYPWTASSTQLKNAILPAHWLAGARSEWRDRLLDPANQEAVLADLAVGIERRGGGNALMLVATDNSDYEGRRLNEVAAMMSLSEPETALRLLQEAPPRVVSFNMDEADIEAFMKQPWVATSSDGTDGHPRKYASFPRKYAHYVQQRKALTLPEFVHRSTLLPAQILGLSDRGRIANGAVADVIVIDPKRYRDAASYQDWQQLTPGVEWLFIAGEPVIAKGRYNGALIGRNLLL